MPGATVGEIAAACVDTSPPFPLLCPWRGFFCATSCHSANLKLNHLQANAILRTLPRLVTSFAWDQRVGLIPTVPVTSIHLDTPRGSTRQPISRNTLTPLRSTLRFTSRCA